jgi:hypothetical protein
MAADDEPMTDSDLMSIEASLTSVGGVQRLRSSYLGFRICVSRPPTGSGPSNAAEDNSSFCEVNHGMG